MTMPEYNLSDHIGWATTRKIPLCDQAVTGFKNLVANSFQDFGAKFAGISKDNNMAYVQNIGEIHNNETFFNAASGIVIPHNLLNFIEYAYVPFSGESFTSGMIAQIQTDLSLVPEFSSFHTALSGMTPANCQESQYKEVFQSLMYFPKFLFDMMTHLIDEEE